MRSSSNTHPSQREPARHLINSDLQVTQLGQVVSEDQEASEASLPGLLPSKTPHLPNLRPAGWALAVLDLVVLAVLED